MEWKRVLIQCRALLAILILIFLGLIEYYCQDLQTKSISAVSEIINDYSENQYTLVEWRTNLTKRKERIQAEMLETTSDFENLFVEEQAIDNCIKWACHISEYQHNQEKIEIRAGQLDRNSTDTREKIKYQAVSDKFRQLKNVDVSIGNDYALITVYNNQVMQWILLVISIILVFHFFEERKKGLWQYVYTTFRGRDKIVITREVIVLVVVTICTVFSYSIMFALTWKVTGTPNFARNIQSIAGFEQFPLMLNVGQWIIYFLVIKVIINIAVAFLIYFLMSIVNTRSIGLLIFLSVIGIEWFLYKFIMDNGFLYVLKLCNLFRILSTMEWTVGYEVVCIGERAVSMQGMIIASILVINCFLIMGIVLLNVKRKPSPSVGMFQRVIEMPAIGRVISAVTPIFTEVRKSFLWNKGFFVIALAVFIVVKNTELADFPYKHTDTRLKHVYERCGGDVELAKLELEAMQNELLQYDNIDSGYRMLQQDCTELSNRIEYVLEMHNIGYSNVYVVDTKAYDVYFSESMQTRKGIYSLSIIMSVILIFSSLYAYENKCGMNTIINSTMCGNRKVKTDKKKLVVGTTIVLYFVFWGSLLYKHWYDYGFQGLNRSVRNILQFSDLKSSFTVGQLILIEQLLLVSGLMAVIIIVWCLSHKLTAEQTIIISILILVFPSILSLMGVSFFDCFSLTWYMNLINWL